VWICCTLSILLESALNWILIFSLKLEDLEMFAGVKERDHVMITTTKIRTCAYDYCALCAVLKIWLFMVQEIP
jgi:hypothetical protein